MMREPKLGIEPTAYALPRCSAEQICGRDRSGRPSPTRFGKHDPVIVGEESYRPTLSAAISRLATTTTPICCFTMLTFSKIDSTNALVSRYSAGVVEPGRRMILSHSSLLSESNFL